MSGQLCQKSLNNNEYRIDPATLSDEEREILHLTGPEGLEASQHLKAAQQNRENLFLFVLYDSLQHASKKP